MVEWPKRAAVLVREGIISNDSRSILIYVVEVSAASPFFLNARIPIYTSRVYVRHVAARVKKNHHHDTNTIFLL